MQAEGQNIRKWPPRFGAREPKSEGGHQLVRMQLLGVIEEIGKVVDPAPNEELMCLNIDWFKISPMA